MQKIIKRTQQLIFHRQNDIFSSALILAAMNIVARIFGILRYRALTVYFDEKQIEYLLAAFRLPDFVFELLITGVLSSAFIPLFIKYEGDNDELHENISSIMNFIFLVLIIFVLVMFFGAKVFFPLITPGYSGAEIEYVIGLSKIVLISQLPFLVTGYLISGIAQANKIFIATAVAPILYSLGAIIGTLVLAPTFGILGPVIGVALGAIMFLLVQLPVLFIIKFQYNIFARKIKVVIEFIHLFIPRVMSVLASQIDFTVDLALSTFLSRGSYTAFFFAQRLQFFPVSFLGVTYGQASLPYLSELFKDKKIDELRRIFVNSILQLLFFTVPLSIFFIFARTPIVRIFYGGPKLSIQSTSLTALTLSYFALSIPFHTIFYFIIRSFYATYDTKTPFLISSLSSIINIVLSFTFVFVLHKSVSMLAVSFSIAIIFNVLLSLIIFFKKIHSFDVFKLAKNSIKIYTSAFASSLIAYPLMKILDLLILDTTRTINVFFLLTVTFGTYILSYLFISWVFNIEQIYIVGRLFTTIKEFKRKITEVYTDVG